MRLILQHVKYMPKTLEPGILYVSREFGSMAHLCACGCGAKIRTPLGPTEWSLTETPLGPTLYPSVGNWQQSCRSHYVISNGEVVWCKAWTPQQVLSGREAEEFRRKVYYNTLGKKKRPGFWKWLLGLFRQD